MGFKFRKSKKILPGVRLNLSNKGMGVSFGGKHARYSISPTGRRTTSIKVAPGLTYTSSSGGKKRKKGEKSNTSYTSHTKSSYQPSNRPKKVNEPAYTFSEIIEFAIILFILIFILWIFGISLNWNAIILKVLSILIIALFAVHILLSNIPPLKTFILKLISKNKKTDIENPENNIETVEHTENETKDILEYIDSSGCDIIIQSIEICINEGQASTDVLQRKLKLGYARAARILDELEEMGVVSPCDSTGMRSVLITREMWEQKKITIQQNSICNKNSYVENCNYSDNPLATGQYTIEQYSAANSLRICRESIKIISETTNPDTFFSRYEIILREVTNIEAHSDKFFFDDISPQELRQEVVNAKQEYIHNMIARYWDKTVNDAAGLKTENGKKKRYQKFYDTLERYKSEMSEENIGYYTGKFMFPPL